MPTPRRAHDPAWAHAATTRRGLVEPNEHAVAVTAGSRLHEVLAA